MIADEIERQGGSVRVGLGELKIELPGHLQTESWLALIKQNKAGLINYLTVAKIDREDYEAHVRWSEEVATKENGAE